MLVLGSSKWYFNFVFQSVGRPKWSNTKIRQQDVHTNGPVLDDILMADPQVTTISMIISFVSLFERTNSLQEVFMWQVTLL